MKINHYIRRSILFAKDYYIMPLRDLIKQKKTNTVNYDDVYPFFSQLDRSNLPSELQAYLFSNNNIISSNLQGKISDNPLDDITCVDCRLANGKCVLHAAWWGANLANNAYIALKRAKGMNGCSLDVQNALRAAEYDKIIADEFVKYYTLFPGRLHTHDTNIQVDWEYLKWGSAEDNKYAHLKQSVSCGAILKLLLDTLGLYQYNFKVKQGDFDVFAKIYDITTLSWNVDYVENRPHDASRAIKIDSRAIKDELLLQNDPDTIIQHLPTTYRSIKNPTNNGTSAYILDYEATHIAITVYVLQFIDYMYNQNMPEFDVIVSEICKIHSFMPTDRWTNYERYKDIVKQKLFKQLARSTYTVATNIERFYRLIQTQLSYLNKEIHKPTLIALHSWDLITNLSQ